MLRERPGFIHGQCKLFGSPRPFLLYSYLVLLGGGQEEGGRKEGACHGGQKSHVVAGVCVAVVGGCGARGETRRESEDESRSGTTSPCAAVKGYPPAATKTSTKVMGHDVLKAHA